VRHADPCPPHYPQPPPLEDPYGPPHHHHHHHPGPQRRWTPSPRDYSPPKERGCPPPPWRRY
jgi:hypothetical protein